MLKDVHGELAVREGDCVEREEREDEFELLSFGLVFLCPFGVLLGKACARVRRQRACALQRVGKGEREKGRVCLTHIA